MKNTRENTRNEIRHVFCRITQWLIASTQSQTQWGNRDASSFIRMRTCAVLCRCAELQILLVHLDRLFVPHDDLHRCLHQGTRFNLWQWSCLTIQISWSTLHHGQMHLKSQETSPIQSFGRPLVGLLQAVSVGSPVKTRTQPLTAPLRGLLRGSSIVQGNDLYCALSGLDSER